MIFNHQMSRTRGFKPNWRSNPLQSLVPNPGTRGFSLLSGLGKNFSAFLLLLQKEKPVIIEIRLLP